MEQAGMSQQDFAAKLGISPASLSSIFTGRTTPTNNHVVAVHRAFPNVNISWLMFGEGDMYTSSSAPSEAAGSAGDKAGMTLFEDVEETRQPVAGEEPIGRVTGVSPIYKEAGGTQRSASFGSDEGASGAERGHFSGRSVSLREEELSKAVNNIDIPTRKIKEIRVFFDDGTYEAFVPVGK